MKKRVKILNLGFLDGERYKPIRVNFELSSYYNIGWLHNKNPTQHPHTIENTWIIQKMELTYFWVGITHAPKTWFLCGLHPLGSSSHVPKDFALCVLFIKCTYICCNEHFHNKRFISLLQHTLVTQKAFNKSDTMKLWKEKYEFEIPIRVLYILEKKNEWIIIPFHLHILNILIH